MSDKDLTKSEAVNKLQTLRKRMSNLRLREHAERGTRVAVGSLVTAGGGFAAGFASVKLPTIPGTQLPTDAVVGLAAVGAAAFGIAGPGSDHLGNFGAGMLAVWAGNEGRKMAAR